MNWADKSKDKLKVKGKELKDKSKELWNTFRPHSPVPPSIRRTEADPPLLAPVPSIRRLEDEAKNLEDHRLAPNHPLMDNDSVSPSVLTRSNSITQNTDQPIPTIDVKENPKSSERPSSPPKRTFVRTANPQHDIAILHVAFVLKDSPDLQDLIVAVEKLKNKPSVR